MHKYLLIAVLPLMLVAEAEMKCEAGKCSVAPSTTSKKVPSKDNSTSAMKCEAGKCSTGASKTAKKVPLKEEASAMKCEAGKCSTGDSKMVQTKPSNMSKKATVEQLFSVKTIEVKEMNTAQEQVNYGYIVAKDSSMVDVLTWYSGFVEKLYADTMYKKVKKGEALVKVYSPEVYKAKQDYLNSINYNMKTSMPEMLKSSKIKLRLLGVSEKEIDAIEKERHADAFTTVYAPISGWIFEKNINEGSSFTSKKPLFQIVNLDKVWMEVKLFQNEIKKLDSLTQFKVKIKSLDMTFDAQKSLLYPMIDPKEATVTLRLTLDNMNEVLKPGMYAKVHASAKSQNRIVIPRTAVIRKSGTWYAFLATEFKGEYEPVEIEVKPLDNKNYEVLKGLNSGDNVVNNALFMMDSDAQINSIY